MDRLDRLRVFQAVADLSSFADGARRLGVTPVAASRAIAALEDELGVPLLRRTTRSVKLTEPGVDYLVRSRRVLAELDDAASAVRGEGADPRGQFVVTAPVVFGRLHVMPLVTDLLTRYPQLHVRLVLLDRRVRLVEEGIDVAIRIGDLPDSSLRSIPLANVRRVLVASPKYLSRKGRPKKPADLAGHDLIAFDNFTPNSEWKIGKHTIGVESRLLTNNVDTAIDAAVQGLGIARLTSYQVAVQLRSGQLVSLLDDFSDEILPITLLYHADRQPSPNVKAFIEVAKKMRTKSPFL
jgi:DNA-binding transcriptional LysR family regulator